jgi:hypothetical protein
VTLYWDASVSATGYKLHYGQVSGVYTIDLDTGPSTSASVNGSLQPGTTYFFAATAYNGAGESGYSNEVSYLVPSSDVTAPSVMITFPANGATVPKKSTVTIQASASDNTGVDHVEFYVDGNLKCADSSSPYSCAWSVPPPPNRTYTLQAKAYDAAGNIGLSALITVTSQ